MVIFRLVILVFLKAVVLIALVILNMKVFEIRKGFFGFMSPSLRGVNRGGLMVTLVVTNGHK